MPESLPFVSIVVPVHNAASALPRLMASLRGQTYPRERFEVILVDNKSTDGSAETMCGFGDAACLSQTRCQTPGATRNVGIEAAQGEIVALIDADCWAHRDWLASGVKALVEGKLDRIAGRVAFVLSPRPNLYELYDSAVNFGQPDFVARGWSGTGNLFVRREVFSEIGLLDPVLRSAEDCEFGLRATAAGKSLGYAPAALVYHRARTRFSSLVKKWMRTEYGAAQVWRRHGLMELHLWSRKANWRPLFGTWKSFPPEVRRNRHLRLAFDLLSNVLRYAGNAGNLAGYFATARRKA